MPHRDKSMSSTMSASMNASRRRRSGRRTGTPATATSRRARREANCKDMRATLSWLYFCCLYYLAAEADSNTPHTIIAQWCACQAVSSQGSSPSLTLPWIGEKRKTCRGERGEGQRAALAIPHRVYCLCVCQLYNVGHTLCRQRVHNQRPGTHITSNTQQPPLGTSHVSCFVDVFMSTQDVAARVREETERRLAEKKRKVCVCLRRTSGWLVALRHVVVYLHCRRWKRFNKSCKDVWLHYSRSYGTTGAESLSE